MSSRVYERLPRRKAPSRRSARSLESASLLRDLDPRANRYLPRIPVGRLRLGIGDPTFMDALSFAGVRDKSDRKAIERAYNLTCDLGLTARDYLRGGVEAMARAQVRVGNPVRMAQAARMSSRQEIVDKIGSAAVEPKLDGFRVQIHRDGDQVRIYSRNLRGHVTDVPGRVRRRPRPTQATTGHHRGRGHGR